MKNGVMEYWSDGVLGGRNSTGKSIAVAFQNSSTPILQHSIFSL
jgi:hypothetical protein